MYDKPREVCRCKGTPLLKIAMEKYSFRAVICVSVIEN